MNLLIKNGTIVNADKSTMADILMVDGKISEIKPSLSAHYKETVVIDAKDRYIIPGGIDPHVHLHLP
ncbi:MAG: dihydropyrimidinase, partial [Chlorobi bacterium]|nr:dihydropyrimidinase [Chlorobiota bacterium]